MEREDVINGCASILGTLSNHYFDVSEYKKEYFDTFPKINPSKFALLKTLKHRVEEKKVISTYNEIVNSIIEERDLDPIKASAFYDYEDVKEAGEKYIGIVNLKHTLLKHWMTSLVKLNQESISIIAKEVYTILKYNANLSPDDLDKAWDYLTKIPEDYPEMSEIVGFIQNTLHVSLDTKELRLGLGGLFIPYQLKKKIDKITEYGDSLGYYDDFENQEYVKFIDEDLLPKANKVLRNKILSVLNSKGYAFTPEEKVAILSKTCTEELGYPYSIGEFLDKFELSYILNDLLAAIMADGD